MGVLVERLAARIASGATPESDLMALGSSDLEALAASIERSGGTLADLRRVHEMLESHSGDASAFSRGLSFEDALEIGTLPGAAAIVRKLRASCPGMPALRIRKAARVTPDRTRMQIEADSLTELRSSVAPLSGVLVWVPVTLSLDLGGQDIVSFGVTPAREEDLADYRKESELALSLGLIGFDDPLPEHATHQVMLDFMSRRILERV